MNPQTSSVYQKRAIESLIADKDPATDFKFQVNSMYMYCCTVDGPRVDDATYLLDLSEVRCQTDKVDNASFGQKNFTVSPSTVGLTVAYQDLRAGTDTRISASKFKCYDAAVSLSNELALNRMFIQYAGQQLPSPDADPSFVAGTDYTTQRYLESQIYAGGYYDSGGCETIKEYHYSDSDSKLSDSCQKLYIHVYCKIISNIFFYNLNF